MEEQQLEYLQKLERQIAAQENMVKAIVGMLEAEKQSSKDRLLFETALRIYITNEELTTPRAFDVAKEFIEEYERRVNCQKD